MGSWECPRICITPSTRWTKQRHLCRRFREWRFAENGDPEERYPLLNDHYDLWPAQYRNGYRFRLFFSFSLMGESKHTFFRVIIRWTASVDRGEYWSIASPERKWIRGFSQECTKNMWPVEWLSSSIVRHDNELDFRSTVQTLLSRKVR